MKVSETKGLRALEEDNRQLKSMGRFTEQVLDMRVLKTLNEKKE